MRDWLDFLGQFARLAGPYWRGERKWRVLGWTAALVVLTAGQVALAVALNAWSERLFDALEQRALHTFVILIGVFALIVVAEAAVVTIHLRIKRRLTLDWRHWLTRRLVDEWMSAGRHHQVTLIPGEHDNPDGRIAEDIRIVTESAVELAHSLLYCLLLLVTFGQILWTLSGDPELQVGSATLYIPGYLVWLAILYAGVGTAVTLLVGRPLVRAANLRQTAEANFRFGLASARENSQAIALLQGEATERSRLADLFVGVMRGWDRQTVSLSHLFMFTSSWSVVSTVFPVLVVAPRYIAGTISLGVLMQTAQAFQQMVAALSWPIDNFARAAEWRASVERVQGLHRGLGRLDEHVAAAPTGIVVERSDKPVLALTDLTVATPTGEVVINAFTLAVGAGEHVLIDGDPAATADLFKAVAGLWPWGSGRVSLPAGATIFFMPQRPYLPAGVLRQAICYPAAAGAFEDTALRTALARVGLDYLASHLDDVDRWDQALAAGEQQRLGFARLLLHRPNWIFMQEATDGLDPEGEAEMMRLLREALPDATVISIAHHPTMEKFHERRVTLFRIDGVSVADGQVAAGAPPPPRQD